MGSERENVIPMVFVKLPVKWSCLSSRSLWRGEEYRMYVNVIGCHFSVIWRFKMCLHL